MDISEFISWETEFGIGLDLSSTGVECIGEIFRQIHKAGRSVVWIGMHTHTMSQELLKLISRFNTLEELWVLDTSASIRDLEQLLQLPSFQEFSIGSWSTYQQIANHSSFQKIKVQHRFESPE